MTISGGWLSRRANSDDNWTNAAFIATSFAAITAILFVASRRGLASQANELIAAGIALAAMISVIRLSNAVCFMGLTRREQEAIFPLAVLLIIGGAGVLRLTCGAILVLLIISSLCSFRYEIRNSVWPGIIFGAVAGLVVFIWTNAWNYASVWLFELTLLGVGPKDSLFHSSISAMLRHYGVSSTGLSGLTAIKYYTGSHAVMAGLSGLADVAPILIYPAGQQIFFEPALIFSIAYCVTVFGKDYDSMNKFATPMMAISFILISSAAMWNSFLASESYCLSLVILFLCTPHLFSPLQRPSAQKALRLSRWLMICASYLVALLLIKTSVAIVLAILVGLVGGVILLDRRPILFIILCISGLLIFIIVIVAASYIIGQSKYSYPILPLSFLRQYPQECIAEIIVVIFGVAALTQEARSMGFCKPWAAIAVWSTVAFASFLPGLVIAIPAGGAGYFSGPIVLLSCIPISFYLSRRANNLAPPVIKDRNSTEAVVTALCVGAFIVVFVVDIRPVGKAREFISRAKILHALGPETSLQSIVSPPPEAPGRLWLLDLGTPFAPFEEKFKTFLSTSPLARTRSRYNQAHISTREDTDFCAAGNDRTLVSPPRLRHRAFCASCPNRFADARRTTSAQIGMQIGKLRIFGL